MMDNKELLNEIQAWLNSSSCFTINTFDFNNGIDICERFEKLLNITNKLPRYKDTGETFIPHVDDAWINTYHMFDSSKKNDTVINASDDYPLEWLYEEGYIGEQKTKFWQVAWGGPFYDVEWNFYSTKEAAEKDLNLR